MNWPFDRLERFPPRRGPEWGSGGIFGLRFHRDVLYYTVAFDAEAHFIHSDKKETYLFELVGEGPRSGGDTYNAVECVDEFIYFGGWVNAPAIYRSTDDTSKIVFTNKFSHVHEYNVENREVRLIWKESVHRDDEWAAEVGDILYDPFNDKLFIMREDGHFNNGVYRLDRRTGTIENVFAEKCLKGCLIRDAACFGVGENYVAGLREMRFLDLVSSRMESHGFGHRSLDGQKFFKPALGEMASAYDRVFAFVRGGMVVGNPYLDEPFTHVRLLDFLNFYAPFRTNSVSVGGGILVPYNAHHDSVYQPSTEEAKTYSTYSNTIAGPSVLLYITPPMVKIVAAFGARITSVEKVGDKILLATNNSPNAGGPKVTPFDSGEKEFVIMDVDRLQREPPPAMFTIPLNRLLTIGEKHDATAFGGIPLSGYRSPTLHLHLGRDNILTVYEYDLSLPTLPALSEKYTVKRGKNIIDLGVFTGIVSFKLGERDADAVAKIALT